MESKIEKKESLKSKALSGVKINSLMVLYKSSLDFISRLILVKLLAPEIFGLMVYAYMIANFAGKFASISGRSAIIQKKKDNVNDLIDVAFTIELFLSIIAALILFFSAPFLMRRLGKGELTFFVQMLSLTLPLTALTFPSVVFTRNLKFKQANIAPAIVTPINIIVTLLLAVLGYGIWSFFWGTLLSSIVSICIIWSIVPYRPKVYLNRSISNDLITFGLPLTGSGILAHFYWNIDDFIVGTMLGAQQLGYYWLAFKVPHYFLAGQGVISRVVFPAFSRAKNDDQLQRGFALVTKYSAIIMLLPCAIALPLGKPAIKFIFGERWLPAAVPFQIYMVLVTIRSIFNYWVQAYLSKKGESRIVLYLTAFNAFSILIIGYFLTKYFGIVGMSVAVLFTIVCTHIVAIITIKKVVPINYVNILFFPCIAFTATLLLGLFIRDLAATNVYSFFAIAVFLSLFYIACLYLLDRRSLYECISTLKEKK